MIYAWFKIFNEVEFLATGLVSKTYTLELEDFGQKEVLVTRSNLTSILYEGVFLPLNLVEKNPYETDDRAVYQNLAGDVFLGIAVDES